MVGIVTIVESEDIDILKTVQSGMINICEQSVQMSFISATFASDPISHMLKEDM